MTTLLMARNRFVMLVGNAGPPAAFQLLCILVDLASMRCKM